MSVIEAVMLGIVQGLTEFLPISSTAHLRVVPALFGLADPGAAYSAIIQLGSVIAVICYFWKDLWEIAGGSLRAIKQRNLDDRYLRLAVAIIVGTIPVCVFGLALKHVLEQPSGPLRSLVVIGVASIVMGLLLLLSERLAQHRRDINNIGVRDGLLVGLGQAMALIPGCSRSGSTLTVAMFLNLKRDDAARFSFLLGIPAIVLSGLLELKESMGTLHADDATNLIVGLVVSLLVSYVAIAWLLKFLRNHSTGVFIIYRLLFGALVLILVFSHRIS